MAVVQSTRDASRDAPLFSEVKDWYNQNLAPDAVDLDDQRVYENVYHDGRWAGVFQCTQNGAQRFFRRAKPRSIVDIATLTSIYRPGPLAAKVDDLYVDARSGKEYDWGDRRINEILKKTDGLIIFQEQVMQLAHEVAGLPLPDCDKLRKAIMKRTIGGGEEAKKKAQGLRDGFVDGAVKNGYDRKIAENLYDRILWFAGYGFNKAHAVSYALDSYFCAWLMTHHEPEWVCAYLQVMSKTPDKRAKAFAEVRGLGYKITTVDVNHSTKTWVALPGKRLVPSFESYKSIGDAAVEEILTRRPFSSLEEMLWAPDGSWRMSKFNKRALESLIKVGGFESLGCVGEGRLFSSYKHMHDVIIGGWEQVKKTSKRNPWQGRDFMRARAADTADCEEWTREEKLANFIEVVGSADVSMLVPPKIMEKLTERAVPSIDDIDEDENDIAWFCVSEITRKTSKKNKAYTLLTVTGPVGKQHKVYVWGQLPAQLKKLSIVMAPLERSQFGFSTNKLVVLI